MIEKMQTKIPQIDYQLPELSVQPKGNYSQYINNSERRDVKCSNHTLRNGGHSSSSISASSFSDVQSKSSLEKHEDVENFDI